MSTPACVSCQEVLSCGDSPLSVTGNVIGILTFVGAFMISVQVYLNSIRNASRNIRDMTIALRSQVGEVDHLMYKLRKQENRINIDRELGHRLEAALNQAQEPIREAATALSQLDSPYYDRKRQLLISAKYVLREEIIKEGLEKAEKAMGMLREVANNVFSEVAPEPADHEVAFRSEILQDLGEIRNEMKNLKETNTKAPEPVDHEVVFRSETLQDLVEIRNEMKNLKETNAKMFHEVRGLLQDLISQPLQNVTERTDKDVD